MIPEAAKRFVEQIGFDEKSKSLLSGCFVHRCHVIHLLRGDHNSCSTLIIILEHSRSMTIP